MARSGEVFWWSLFSQGAVVAGLFAPALIFLTGFYLPSILDPTESYRMVRAALDSWPEKIVVVGVVSLSLFHCFHRIRHTSLDLGLRPMSALVAVLSYGAAVAGTVAAFVAVSGVQ